MKKPKPFPHAVLFLVLFLFIDGMNFEKESQWLVALCGAYIVIILGMLKERP